MYIQIGFYWVECVENSKYRKTWWLGRSSRVNPNLGHVIAASDRQCFRRPKIPVKLGASKLGALLSKQSKLWTEVETLHFSLCILQRVMWASLPSTATLSNFKLGKVENSWISTPSRTKDPWPARMAGRWVRSWECMLREWHVGGTYLRKSPDFAFALMQCEVSFLA